MSIEHGDLVMEVVGDMNLRALEQAMDEFAEVWLWPVARLGDFTLQLRPKRADVEPDVVLGRLRSGGWHVLGPFRRAA